MTALVLHLLLGVGGVRLLDQIPDAAIRIAEPAACTQRLSVGQVHHRPLYYVGLIEIWSPRGRFCSVESYFQVGLVAEGLVRRLPAAAEVIHFGDFERVPLKPLSGATFRVALYRLIGKSDRTLDDVGTVPAYGNLPRARCCSRLIRCFLHGHHLLLPLRLPPTLPGSSCVLV